MLPGYFLLQESKLQCRPQREILQEDKECKSKKNQRERNFSCFAITPFAASITHEFVKTGRPPEPQTRLSHSYPAASYSPKGFFLSFLPLGLQNTQEIWEGNHFFFLFLFFVVYVVPHTMQSNLAEIVSFNCHGKFERQVYSHFIHRGTTAHKDIWLQGSQIMGWSWDSTTCVLRFFPLCSARLVFLWLSNLTQGLSCFNCCSRTLYVQSS